MRLWWLEPHRIMTPEALVCAVALCVGAAAWSAPASALAAEPVKTTKSAPTKADKQAAATKKQTDQKSKKQASQAAKHAKAQQQQDVDVAAKLPWVGEANWLALRAGVAGTIKTGRPEPGPGFGIGYQHFINRRWSTGIQADFDLLGKQGAATEQEVPIHLEMVRHFDWGDHMRPFLGLSAGGTYYRVYRTGDDFAAVRPSFMVVSGANMPVGPRSLVGIDFRFGWENDALSDNPVYPNGAPSLMTYRLKFAYLRWQ